ncbi:MAG: VIT1/CCC1 transporter family protein [Caulobacteraceae bacterium]
MARLHREYHLADRIGWLRAAVLGANDGIVSTASLIAGVAAASADRSAILLAGTAGLVAGAMSMAAGEYVSVNSQSDTERADLARERLELAEDPEHELNELTEIYIGRGVEPALARQVAVQMTANDALTAHARDELGIVQSMRARPVQAAMASAASFAAGAALPLLVAASAPLSALAWAAPAASLMFLAVLGLWSARMAGAKPLRPVARVVFWGAVAMAITAGAGALFGAVV